MHDLTGLILILPVLLQAVIMIIDEFYFHHRRGLGLWERIGHPLDTLTVLFCLLFVSTTEYSYSSALFFTMLAGFSCLFIAKDEFVHKDLCPHWEMLLHAFLFVLHPLVFFTVFKIWKEGQLHIGFYMPFEAFIKGQIFLTSAFLFYQITYWSFYKRKDPAV